MKIKQLMLYLIVIIVLVPTINSLQGSSTNYKAQIYFGSGGTTESTLSYDVNVGYGQSVIGHNKSKDYEIGHGLFYTYSTNNQTVTIQSIILLLLNDTNGTYYSHTGDINITGKMITPSSGNMSIYSNGTLIKNEINSTIQDIRSWGIGNYNITLIYNGDNNYLGSQEEHLLVITGYNYYYINYTDRQFNNNSADVLCFQMTGGTICFDSITNTTFWE